MASQLTWYTELQEPTINADINAWGAILNSTNAAWDRALAGVATDSVAAGDWMPTTPDAECLVLKATGVLGANRNIILPNKNRRYIIWNATTGAFTVTAKTSAGTGVACTQGEFTLIYVDYVGGNIAYKVGPTLGTAATANTGTSGHTLGFLDGNNTYSGTATFTGQVVMSGNAGAPLQLTYVDAGASWGPTLISFRDSASPAAADQIGAIRFDGRDSATNQQEYARLYGYIVDPTSGSEDGELVARTIVAGALGDRVRIGAGIYSDGVTGGDKGAGSANFTTIYQANTALGTAAFVNTGTSGGTVPLLNASVTWSNSAAWNLSSGGVTITTSQPGTVFSIVSTDASATVGPRMVVYRNSASPAASDSIGQILWRGKDSGGNDADYVSAEAFILDPTDGSEDSVWSLATLVAGASAVRVNIAAGIYSQGVSGGDKGAGTANFTTIYQNNVALGTAAFVATGTSGATIPLLNGNNTYSGTSAFTGTVTMSGGSGSPATFTYADNGALVGPTITFLRDSASPAASDLLASLVFQGRDSAANLQTYAAIGSTITDATSTSEDATLDLQTVVAGTVATRGQFGAGFFMAGTTDQGAGTVNATGFYKSGNLLKVTTQVLTASGTYTPTTGAVYAIVEVVGGGGGGGGADATSASNRGIGGGGGGGGYAREIITLSGTYSFTIGAAGTAGTNAGGNGGTGGTTTFGTGPLLQATGGAGGTGIQGSSADIAASPGGVGGVGSSGDLNISGGPGLMGWTMPFGNPIISGAGGCSIFGGGGIAVTRNSGGSTAGNAGGNYGAGGSGAACYETTSGAAGGAGSAGVVVVTEFTL